MTQYDNVSQTLYQNCYVYINYSEWQEFWLTVEDSEYFLGLFVPEGPGPEGRVLPAAEPHKARAKQHQAPNSCQHAGHHQGIHCKKIPNQIQDIYLSEESKQIKAM